MLVNKGKYQACLLARVLSNLWQLPLEAVDLTLVNRLSEPLLVGQVCRLVSVHGVQPDHSFSCWKLRGPPPHLLAPASRLSHIPSLSLCKDPMQPTVIVAGSCGCTLCPSFVWILACRSSLSTCLSSLGPARLQLMLLEAAGTHTTCFDSC